LAKETNGVSDGSMKLSAVTDDTPIWRYMDVGRFVSMLSSGQLWFAKAAQFHDDAYEGHSIVIPPDMPEDEYAGKWLCRERTPGDKKIITPDRMMAEFARVTADYLEAAREHLHVNSWCLAEESIGMWQIYGSSGHGIAVKSSVGRYKRAERFGVRPEQYAFDKVKYHRDISSCPDLRFDLRVGTIPMPGPGVWEKILGLGFQKRICFSYESEWRATLYQDRQPDSKGCAIDFDLKELIEEVYVGPRADSFMVDAVADLVKRFGLVDMAVRKSELLRPPERLAAGLS
jgi:hypothetical protein